MKVSGGEKEDGIVIGNTFDKYGSKNPVVRWMMAGFNRSLSTMVQKVSPKTIHEIGCGEGFWVMQWNSQGINARGSDFSSQVVELAKKNATEEDLSAKVFKQRSIYDIDKINDSADLIVCCEVLEHLEFPEDGLRALKRVAKKHVILSVPREPVWCLLNMLRGKYLADFGNTPGHIQNWSRSKFISLVSKHFDVIYVKSPFPWTMLLCKVKDKQD